MAQRGWEPAEAGERGAEWLEARRPDPVRGAPSVAREPPDPIFAVATPSREPPDPIFAVPAPSREMLGPAREVPISGREVRGPGREPPDLPPATRRVRALESSDLDWAASAGGPAKHAVLSARSGLSGWLQRRGVRVDPGHRAGVAMGLAALVAALVAGWWVLSSRPNAVAVSSSPAPAATSASPGSPSSSGTLRLVIDVVGKVRRPGVYHLPAGARVDDALGAAGGAVSGVDLSSLNLARKLTDGEQIAVGVTGAGAPAVPGTGSPAGSASGPIDLNTAGVAQLDTLPGVGPVLAQRIIDWRTAHGRFDSIDQLREVTGIGDSRFADLKPLVTV